MRKAGQTITVIEGELRTSRAVRYILVADESILIPYLCVIPLNGGVARAVPKERVREA